MDDWKKPPPKFVKTKKKTRKIVLLNLSFTLISILALVISFSAVKWLNLSPLVAIIAFVVVFVLAIIINMIIRVFYIVDLTDEISKKF